MRRRRVVLGLVVFIPVVIAVAMAYYTHADVKGTPSLTNLTPLSLDGHQRVLILAPHCDDETLGSAGLIQSALRAGMEVQVVIATNGDGYLFATMGDFHRVYPTHADYIRMGKLRQQESLAAMQVLGLKPEQVSFLGYPDRGTARLWDTNWSANNPYRSPFTAGSRSPYPLTYNPDSVYAGENLLADLSAILSTYQPDLVIYPHPDDLHPDHWGLSAFTRLAVALQEQKNLTFHPDMYAYLVHRSDFPNPRGLLPTQNLLPPLTLYELDPSSWFRLDLDQEEVIRKSLAVYQYKSQLPLLHKLLFSFIRANEVFAQPQPAALADLAAGDPLKPDTWQDAHGHSIDVIQKDPVLDVFTRTAVAAADLTAVYAARTPQNSLIVCGQVRSKTDPLLIYRLHLLSVSPQGIVHHKFVNRGPSNVTRIKLNGPYFCAEVPLSDLGDPWLVFVGANVEEIGVGILDQIAWQQVNIAPAPVPGK
jgi:N-acetyl-1-D-myo-inositol-2-amino-2-deoxy-alpha-D-glucopyranoside deacetylase